MRKGMLLALPLGVALAGPTVVSGATKNAPVKDGGGCRFVMIPAINRPAKRLAPCHPRNSVFHVWTRGANLLRGDLLNQGKVARLYGRGIMVRGVQRGRDWHITAVTPSAQPVKVAIRLEPF